MNGNNQKRDNTFAIFRNNQKVEGSNRPDRTGSATITCPHCGQSAEHYLDGWIRNDKAGNQYLWGQIKPKVPKAAGPQNQAEPVEQDIPFVVNECVFEVGTKLHRRLSRGRKDLFQVRDA